MKRRDPRRFGRKAPNTATRRKHEACAWVAVICLVGSVFCSVIGYALPDRGAASFAFFVSILQLVVAVVVVIELRDYEDHY